MLDHHAIKTYASVEKYERFQAILTSDILITFPKFSRFVSTALILLTESGVWKANWKMASYIEEMVNICVILKIAVLKIPLSGRWKCGIRFMCSVNFYVITFKWNAFLSSQFIILQSVNQSPTARASSLQFGRSIHWVEVCTEPR
jgi:hypothetical protein